MNYFEFSRRLALDPPDNTVQYELHRRTLGKYAALPLWERIARSMAEALEVQPLYIYPEDTLIGRTYHRKAKEPEVLDPDLAKYPLWEQENYPQLHRNQLVLYNAPGHIAWD